MRNTTLVHLERDGKYLMLNRVRKERERKLKELMEELARLQAAQANVA